MIQTVPSVLKNSVKIHPNPTNDIIIVEISTNKQPNLQLYSLNGVLLKEGAVKTMIVSDIASGMYILRVMLKNNTSSYPVLIIKLYNHFVNITNVIYFLYQNLAR